MAPTPDMTRGDEMQNKPRRNASGTDKGVYPYSRRTDRKYGYRCMEMNRFGGEMIK